MDKNKYCKKLRQYIDDCKSELLSFAMAFEWEADLKQVHEKSNDLGLIGDKLPQHDKYLSMIYTIKEHARNAGRSMQNMYSSTNELPDPIPKHFLGHKNMAITISDDVKFELFKSTRTSEKGTIPASPVTSDDYFADYTAEERNILYKFVVSNCVKVMPPQDLVVDNLPESADLSKNATATENEELLMLEKLKEERDLKRRRQAYRRKVSTKNKSQVEVTREVIGNVMEALGYTTEAPIAEDKANTHDTIADFNTKNQLGVWASPPTGFDTFRFSRKRDFLEFRRDVEAYESKDYPKMGHQSKSYNCYGDRISSENMYNSRKTADSIKSTISENDRKMRYTSADSEKKYRSSRSAKRKLDSGHEKRSSESNYEKNRCSSSYENKRYYKESDPSYHEYKDNKHEKSIGKCDYGSKSYSSSHENKKYRMEKDSSYHKDDSLKHKKCSSKSDYDRHRHSSSRKSKKCCRENDSSYHKDEVLQHEDCNSKSNYDINIY